MLETKIAIWTKVLLTGLKVCTDCEMLDSNPVNTIAIGDFLAESFSVHC